jgi:hypothetical protein
MGVTLRLHEVESNGHEGNQGGGDATDGGDDNNEQTPDASGSEDDGYLSSFEECGGEAIGGDTLENYFADVLANMWG